MENIKQHIQNFVQNNKQNIISALILLLVVDVLFAVFFGLDFSQTGLCRNMMLMDSKTHACSALEFAKYNWSWISFMDVFVFVPAIVWAMIMPEMVRKAKEAEIQD